VHLWDPPFCGDMDIVIKKDGTWIHEGSPIKRQAMIALFASILMRADDGDYYLVTPVEKVRIQVEDCPFVALDVDVEGQGNLQTLSFTTNTGEVVTAGKENMLYIDVDKETGEPHPVLHIRRGLYALINRAVFYRLVNLVEQAETAIGKKRRGVWSAGIFFELDRDGQLSAIEDF